MNSKRFFLVAFVSLVSGMSYANAGFDCSVVPADDSPEKSQIKFYKDGREYPLDQNGVNTINSALEASNCVYNSDADVKGLERRMGGSIDELGMAMNAGLKQTGHAKLTSTKQSELVATCSYLKKALNDVDTEKMEKMRKQRRQCAKSSESSLALYDALSCLASRKSCDFKSAKVGGGALTRSIVAADKGGAPSGDDCAVSVQSDVGSRVGSIDFISKNGETQSLDYGSHLEPNTNKDTYWLYGSGTMKGLIKQMQENGYCNLDAVPGNSPGAAKKVSPPTQR